MARANLNHRSSLETNCELSWDSLDVGHVAVAEAMVVAVRDPVVVSVVNKMTCKVWDT